MEPILLLVHRIPFPPNKGDKIRSFHLLRFLSEHYRVHLGTFIDDADDARHVHELDALCASHRVVPLNRSTATLRSMSGFVTGAPLTLPFYRSAELRRWVAEVIAAHNIRKAVVFSAAMAQYIEPHGHLHAVLDMVDVDSAKWTQYAEQRHWPASAVFRREGRKLLAFERNAAERATATVFVTRAEADLFTSLAPEFGGKTQVIENGVDTDYFAPSDTRKSPFAANEAAIVFTGAMDYWPNIDAVVWFVREVLPQILEKRPDARFYIVGMNPAKIVSALADGRSVSVTVTGKVPDMRPYLQHAAAVVAPLRVARGIQNKILEAMAMGRPVVVSTAAANGVTAMPGVDLETAGDAATFGRQVLKVMQPQIGHPMGVRARARVLSDYCWQRNLEAFGRLIESSAVRSLLSRESVR